MRARGTVRLEAVLADVRHCLARKAARHEQRAGEEPGGDGDEGEPYEEHEDHQSSISRIFLIMNEPTIIIAMTTASITWPAAVLNRGFM